MPNLDRRAAAAVNKAIQLERRKAIKEYAAREGERKAKRLAAADARKERLRRLTAVGTYFETYLDGWEALAEDDRKMLAGCVGQMVGLHTRIEQLKASARQASIEREGMLQAALKIQSIWTHGEMLLTADVQEVIDQELTNAANDAEVLERVDKVLGKDSV